jgi:Flp pilus assembly protein TadG
LIKHFFVAGVQLWVASALIYTASSLQKFFIILCIAFGTQPTLLAVTREYKAMKRVNKGQVAVIYALISVALVGAVSLGTDVGILYYNWAQLQKAADTAVLGGANYLPDNPDSAKAMANQLAETNGVKATEIISTVVAPNNLSITMTVQRTVPYSFAKVLGLANGYADAAATATPQFPPSTVNATTPGTIPSGGDNSGNNGSTCATTCSCGIIPIGLNSNTVYSDGSQITLQQGEVGPGNWDFLALGGVGGNNLRTNIANGYNGMITVGDWVTTEPGKKVGPADNAFQDRLNCASSSDPNGTYSSHTVANARVMVMPVVNWANQNGRKTVQVTAFATVWLDTYNQGAVTVHFISQVVANSFGNPTAPFFGARGTPTLSK